MGVHHKMPVHWGVEVRNENFESQWRGQRKKDVPKRTINLSEQLP